MTVNNSTNINKTNGPLSSSFTEHKKKPTTYDVAIAINVLACDRHKHVTGLNRLMGPQSSPLDYWISNENTYILKQTIIHVKFRIYFQNHDQKRSKRQNTREHFKLCIRRYFEDRLSAINSDSL